MCFMRMNKRKLQTNLELTLYVLAAKSELDNLLIGLGDVERAAQYIWDAYELADSKLKKLLKQAYDLINSGNAWRARQLLEKIVEKNRRPCPGPEEF